jgi:hypothetical protein
MTMGKIEALKKFLVENGDYTEEELSEIEIAEGYDENIAEVINCEYMVLTDKEADQAAKEYIEDSVWAFNSNFIIDHSDVLSYDKASENVVKAIQEQCESGNEAMKKLINNMDEFVQDAIEADGRGHFLNTYDGEEYEVGDYYIYRMN